MRETLEDLYYGNITPYDRQIRFDTSLMKAMEQSQECEEQTAGGRSPQSAAAAHQRGERDRQHAGSGKFHPGLPSGSASDPGSAGRGRWQSGGTAPQRRPKGGTRMTTNQLPIQRCRYCGSEDLGMGWQHGEGIVTFKKHGILGNRMRCLICRRCGAVLFQ